MPSTEGRLSLVHDGCAERNSLFYINSAEPFSHTRSFLCLAKCCVFSSSLKSIFELSAFPHLLVPDLLPSHSFPQFSSLRAHFINPLSTWLPASLLCHTLSPPMWSWARKSIIELLITVLGSSGSSQAQCLTQQIPTGRNKPDPGGMAGSE